MNIKLILLGLSIILINTLIGMVAILKLHMPYTSSMFLFTVFSLLLWFFLLRKDVPITIKAIDATMIKKTLTLLLIPIAASAFILTTSPSVDYGVVGFLLITAFLIAVYEEILFRAIWKFHKHSSTHFTFSLPLISQTAFHFLSALIRLFLK